MKSLLAEFNSLYSTGGYKHKRDVYKSLGYKYGYSYRTIENYIRDERLAVMDYNKKHFAQKDVFTNSAIDLYVNVFSKTQGITVFDAFGGKNISFYKDSKRCTYTKVLDVLSNDLQFIGHDYHLAAKNALKMLRSLGKTFDIIDIDAYGVVGAADCLDEAIRICDGLLLLTLGQFSRCRHTKAVEKAWHDVFYINGGSDAQVPKQIENRVNEIAQFSSKTATLDSFVKFEDGTYRFSFLIK